MRQRTHGAATPMKNPAAIVAGLALLPLALVVGAAAVSHAKDAAPWVVRLVAALLKAMPA